MHKETAHCFLVTVVLWETILLLLDSRLIVCRNSSEHQVPPAPLSQRSLTTPLPPPPPRQGHAPRDSIAGRPASSVYSQPSPLHTDFRLADRPVKVNVRYHHSPDEVSPPSSPELLSPGHEYVHTTLSILLARVYFAHPDVGSAESMAGVWSRTDSTPPWRCGP